MFLNVTNRAFLDLSQAIAKHFRSLQCIFMQPLLNFIFLIFDELVSRSEIKLSGERMMSILKVVEVCDKDYVDDHDNDD